MTGGNARSKTGKVYSYYWCNNARLKVCSKKGVRKEQIEDLVVKKCRELLTDKNINKIVKEVAAIAEKEQDKSEQTILKRKLREIDKAIENLMKALESGQNIDLINERITAKREERAGIEKDLAIEIKKSVALTEPEIRSFLTKLKKGNINDIKYRQALITVFVNSIYLFDDNRLTIIFNADKEPVVVDNVLLDEIVENSGDTPGLDSERFGSPNPEVLNHKVFGIFP